ncbi:MAG TPA: FtsX-like permease family protein [Acidimicrobiales bacterium]|nr:FtsX-like permease family protein [Acidimicrobiales bacterium]
MGGRLRLVARLAGRDVHRRWSEALLLVLAIAAGSATLTLGMLLHNVTTQSSGQSYSQTQAATRGPDLVAQSATLDNGTTSPADLAALVALSHAKGVVASSGPYPMATADLRTPTVTGGATVEGRSESPAAVDQPLVTAGTWVRPGGVVVERAFAQAAGVEVGQVIRLNGRAFTVDGIAVTAAFSPYPQIGCFAGCFGPQSFANDAVGLLWTTEAGARSLATASAPLTYFSNLKLADPTQATAVANAQDNNNYTKNPGSPNGPYLLSAQQIAHEDNNLIVNEQIVVLVGSTLLTILSIASVAVLVGGRMADQMRRVGLLKAIGGTPGLVASVLMAEYLFLALVGAAVGLLGGWLFAPLLSSPGSGLLGSAPRPPLTVSSVLIVAGVALGVALVAALVPALRAAQTSTVRALADSARPPHRSALLVRLSARLPVPLLIGLRVMARRLRRTTLSVLSIFVTVSGVVAVLIVHGRLNSAEFNGVSGLVNPRTTRANEVLLAVTVGLVVLAAVNAVFITRAIAQDARHASAVTRALGATPQQVTAGLSLAQMLPALIGSLLGIPGGFLLYNAAKHGGQSETMPPVPELLAVIVGAVLLVAVLTAIPARWGARRPVASILQAELA